MAASRVGLFLRFRHYGQGHPPGRTSLFSFTEIDPSFRCRYTVAARAYQRCEATVENHTMNTSLPRYLRMKVHQSVLERVYEGITVVSAYKRSHTSIIFQGERQNKPFNWQRPTARVVDNHFYIECFPGYNHVGHYAEIIATYLRIRQSEGDVLTLSSKVSFILSSCSDTQTTLKATNLGELPGGVDTGVLGLAIVLSS